MRQSDQLRDGWIEESRYTGGGGMGMRGGPAKGASGGGSPFLSPPPEAWIGARTQNAPFLTRCAFVFTFATCYYDN